MEFADAAGALVDVVAVAGDARPLCDARDEEDEEEDDAELGPGVEPFVVLSFVFPGAVSLLPCAMTGPAAHTTLSTKAKATLTAFTTESQIEIGGVFRFFYFRSDFRRGQRTRLCRRCALERLNRLPERHRG